MKKALFSFPLFAALAGIAGFSQASEGQYQFKVQKLIAPDSVSVQKVVDKPRYIQDHWLSRWTDRDGNCRDARNDLLVERSLANTAFASDKKCVVVAGTWIDAYTQTTVHQPDKLSIDHVIPLAYAHHIGGHAWPRPLREAFSEDGLNLMVVSANALRAKGERGPSQWLPREGRCVYHDIWRATAKKYKLSLLEEDEKALVKLYRNECAEYTPVSIQSH